MVATYLFWVAQSRANISVAQSRNIPILSRNGRNIPFLDRAKSQHTLFGSRKIATYLLWVAQSRIKFLRSRIPILSRNGCNIPDLGRNGRNLHILSRNGRNISPRTRLGISRELIIAALLEQL